MNLTDNLVLVLVSEVVGSIPIEVSSHFFLLFFLAWYVVLLLSLFFDWIST